MHLFMQFEAINIDFWHFLHFGIMGTGWVGLQLSVILMGRFDM